MCITRHYRSKTIKLRYLENLHFPSQNFTHTNNDSQAFICVCGTQRNTSTLDVLDCCENFVGLSIYGLTLAIQNSSFVIYHGNNFNKSNIRAINPQKPYDLSAKTIKA